VLAEIRDSKLGGVGLEGADKQRYNELQQELSKLSTAFSNNVLDSTKAFSKLITNKSDVQGLPDSALALAAQTAAAKGHEGATPEEGPWMITLDFPSYLPVLTHCTNRALREELYRAFISRASSGDKDNTPNIARILALRKEKAALVGMDSHAEVSMAAKVRGRRLWSVQDPPVGSRLAWHQPTNELVRSDPHELAWARFGSPRADGDAAIGVGAARGAARGVV
jgi:oligopeptidase A